MLISVKLLTKYVVIIYALSLVQESSASESKPLQRRSKATFPARLGEKYG